MILLSLLSACATPVYKTKLEIYCPPLKEYTQEFNKKLASEVERLPSDAKTVEALSDYVALRDTIRACNSQRDK